MISWLLAKFRKSEETVIKIPRGVRVCLALYPAEKSTVEICTVGGGGGGGGSQTTVAEGVGGVSGGGGGGGSGVKPGQTINREPK